MKNLFEPGRAAEVQDRLARLTPTSERLWGKMSPAQAVAHCALSMETALGEHKPPQMLLGRVIGGLVKGKVLGNDDPFRRNSPTAPAMVVRDDCNLDAERARLRGLIDRFVAAGPAGCTTHPHSFFGRLTPDEWATLAYKHLDHHLRQFGV